MCEFSGFNSERSVLLGCDAGQWEIGYRHFEATECHSSSSVETSILEDERLYVASKRRNPIDHWHRVTFHNNEVPIKTCA